MACAEILARHATEVWLLEEAKAGQGSQAPPGAITTLVSPPGAALANGMTIDALDIHDVASLTRYAIRTGLVSADT